MAIKVAHFGQFGPNQAGISGTAIDMIMAERTVGIDAQYIDYEGKKPSRVGLTANGVTTVGPSWSRQADIIVRHSAIPPSVEALGKPHVMCLHGRPEYLFMLEYTGKSKIISEYLKCVESKRYAAFITFWQEHFEFLNMLLPDTKIDFVPAMVNLEVFKPSGIRLDYDSEGGDPNILIADMFRQDTTPFNILMATAAFVREFCPEAKVHIYGLQRTKESPVKDLVDGMRKANVLGQAEPLTRDMERIYRAVDMVVTPHHIATRVVREALASGVPVVAGQGCPYTKYTADARHSRGFAIKINECWNDIRDDRWRLCKEARAMAEESFNLKQAGEAALEVYERVMQEPKPKIEMRTKPMIYNFIAYATDSEGGGKDLGAAYNRYMNLLPNDNDWACFIDHDAMWTTQDWFKRLGEIIAANPAYGLLTACTNRVGNNEQKIATVDISSDMLFHRKIGSRLQIQEGLKIKDVTDTHRISGVVMLVKKSVWKAAGGFKGGFLGVDNDFHSRVVKAGSKVGVMRGIYVYHWYRQSDSTLKPVNVAGKQ
jgi:glycosyltransferase involved in cell wall biosynthesis